MVRLDGGRSSGQNQRTLSPGHYWFDDGISLSGGSQIHGTGVTIHIPAGKKISTGGNSQIHISGPTANGCPESGVVIHYYDTGSTSLFALSGNSSVEVSGIVYAPQTNLNFSGTPDLTIAGSIIANSLTSSGHVKTKFSGNSCQHHYTNSGPGQVAIYE